MAKKPRSAVFSFTRNGRGCIPAACADCRYSKPSQSLKVVLAGRALPRRSARIISEAFTIPAMAWPERRSFALVAARTKGMSLWTARLRPGGVFALIQDRLRSHPMGNRFPTNSTEALPKVNR